MRTLFLIFALAPSTALAVDLLDDDTFMIDVTVDLLDEVAFEAGSDLYADEPAEEDEDFTADPVTTGLPRYEFKDEGGDTFEFTGPTELPVEAPKAAVVVPSVGDQAPLADNWPLALVSTGKDHVVVELPVLLARARAGFEGDFLLIGEVSVGGQPVTEVRQLVQATSIAALSPTLAFLKAAVPVDAPTGEIRVVVKRAKPDGSEPVELFAKTADYALE